MASPDLMARLRYLSNSAHLLTTTGPATSRLLMSQCSLLMFDNNIELSEAHRRKACGACGTIMILGLDGKLEVQLQRRRRARGDNISGKAFTGHRRAIVYTCESCGRKTRINSLASPSSVPKRKSALPQTKHTLSVTQSSNTSISAHSTPPRSKSNTASTSISGTSVDKKHTKSRKQSGLGGILARQKAADGRGSSEFHLLDFMKKA